MSSTTNIATQSSELIYKYWNSKLNVQRPKVEHSSRDIASEVITKIQNQSYEFIYEYWN